VQNSFTLSLVTAQGQRQELEHVLFVLTPSNKDDVAIAGQFETKIFIFQRGDVVIEQSDWPEDHSVIVVRPENAPSRALRLLKVAGYGDLELVRNLGGAAYEDFDLDDGRSRPGGGRA
jgi:hypothetical protein